jgi:hypothetical protein
MKEVVVKMHIKLEIEGRYVDITTHVNRDNIPGFTLDTKKYPDAKLVSVTITDVKIIF